MAANPLPAQLDQLLALADEMSDALATHEVSIGIKQNTKAALDAAIANVATKEQTYGTAQAAKLAAVAQQQRRRMLHLSPLGAWNQSG